MNLELQRKIHSTYKYAFTPSTDSTMGQRNKRLKGEKKMPSNNIDLHERQTYKNMRQRDGKSISKLLQEPGDEKY